MWAAFYTPFETQTTASRCIKTSLSSARRNKNNTAQIQIKDWTFFENELDSTYIQNEAKFTNLYITCLRPKNRGHRVSEDAFNKFVQEKKNCNMQLMAPTVLLFALNLLDAILTIIWVRSGIATEGNQLMASLLEIGNGPFLGVKIAIGLVATVVLLRSRNQALARFGLAVALAVYLGLMVIHLFTGLAAAGVVSNTQIHELANWPTQFFA